MISTYLMKSRILTFTNGNGSTIYNPTIPFQFEKKKYMGVRVESFDSELDSQTFFAYEQNKNAGLWTIDYSLASLPLQDPVHVTINGEVVIMGIKVWQEKEEIKWKQEMYRGDSIKNLEYFTSGPIGMKDIRLVDLEDRVGVFTRPQGKIGGKGKIGYLEIGSVDELKSFTENDWFGAKLIEDLFDDSVWGGVAQAIKISGNEMGVIGHKAHITTNKENQSEKHYYGIAFRFNPKTWLTSNYKVIAKRDDFPSSPAKRSPELNNVFFSSGIEFDTNYLTGGLSDFCIGQKKITNPF